MTVGDDQDRAAERAAERAGLMAEIDREMRETAIWLGKDRLDERVRAAMDRVPREAFVPAEAAAGAYLNTPLKIGHGQTISQPYIVAVMTDMLRPQPDDVVLEVGTGSGYQAAVLSLLVRQVYSIEVVRALAEAAAERLQRLGYHNVEVRHGDGYAGWPEHAPFDAITVTAAAKRVPPPLIEQLKEGGRLVIPIGRRWATQDLMLVEKDESGKVEERRLLPVAFVPLTRKR
ncbi:MAG: protein-L-isoaspartate(D-aspartate) O-methyltransferase [Kiloniellales bacterium]